MASLVVADPSLSHFKITLWREAAEWAEKIKTGDIVLFCSKPCFEPFLGFTCVCVCGGFLYAVGMVILGPAFWTEMRMKQWQGEVLAHTTMTSHVLNLHQTESLPDRCEDFVSWVVMVKKYFTLLTDTVKHQVPGNCLRQFLHWAKEEHFYLFHKINAQPESSEKCLLSLVLQWTNNVAP